MGKIAITKRLEALAPRLMRGSCQCQQINMQFTISFAQRTDDWQHQRDVASTIADKKDLIGTQKKST